jgi:DNA-binding XRE family transcriptional regulator
MVKEQVNPFKAAREKLGLTQQMAAVHVGVAIATWCRWENGVSKPLPEHLMLLKLLPYFTRPGSSPESCMEGARMSWSTDEFEEHLRKCEVCRLRIEFLRREMYWK